MKGREARVMSREMVRGRGRWETGGARMATTTITPTILRASLVRSAVVAAVALRLHQRALHYPCRCTWLVTRTLAQTRQLLPLTSYATSVHTRTGSGSLSEDESTGEDDHDDPAGEKYRAN